VTEHGDSTGGFDTTPSAGVADAQAEIRQLRERLAGAQAALESLRNRCEDLEEDKAHLGRLCVASAQLHESASPAESLRALQDVLINLLGSEQIAIWSLRPDGRTLELRASQGIEAESWRTVVVGEGDVGKAAASGDIPVPGPAALGQPALCIPLKLGERVTGVVAVFRLLPHRSGFHPRDQEVFELIARQAAFSLHCSGDFCGCGGRAGDG
jgi:hypothetical protein